MSIAERAKLRWRNSGQLESKRWNRQIMFCRFLFSEKVCVEFFNTSRLY